MKYLKFVECQNDGRTTKVWMVRNGQNEDLGAICFRPQWRKYIFRFNPTLGQIDFDAVCMREIVDFAEKETKLWRESL